MTTTDQGISLTKAEAAKLFYVLNNLRIGNYRSICHHGNVKYVEITANFDERGLQEVLYNRDSIESELARYFDLVLM